MRTRSSTQPSDSWNKRTRSLIQAPKSRAAKRNLQSRRSTQSFDASDLNDDDYDDDDNSNNNNHDDENDDDHQSNRRAKPKRSNTQYLAPVYVGGIRYVNVNGLFPPVFTPDPMNTLSGINRFIYNSDGFQVIIVSDLGSETTYSLYTRALVPELRPHVFPEVRLTRGGHISTHQPDPVEEKPYTYYLAQLIHYGLEFEWSKDAAKFSLARAIHRQTLRVPKLILRLERQLKYLWESKTTVGVHIQKRGIEEMEMGEDIVVYHEEGQELEEQDEEMQVVEDDGNSVAGDDDHSAENDDENDGEEDNRNGTDEDDENSTEDESDEEKLEEAKLHEDKQSFEESLSDTQVVNATNTSQVYQPVDKPCITIELSSDEESELHREQGREQEKRVIGEMKNDKDGQEEQQRLAPKPEEEAMGTETTEGLTSGGSEGGLRSNLRRISKSNIYTNSDSDDNEDVQISLRNFLKTAPIIPVNSPVLATTNLSDSNSRFASRFQQLSQPTPTSKRKHSTTQSSTTATPGAGASHSKRQKTAQSGRFQKSIGKGTQENSHSPNQSQQKSIQVRIPRQKGMLKSFENISSGQPSATKDGFLPTSEHSKRNVGLSTNKERTPSKQNARPRPERMYTFPTPVGGARKTVRELKGVMHVDSYENNEDYSSDSSDWAAWARRK